MTVTVYDFQIYATTESSKFKSMGILCEVLWKYPNDFVRMRSKTTNLNQISLQGSPCEL